MIAVALASCGGSAAQQPAGVRSAVIEGRVTAGPTCPVEQFNRPCPPRPVVTNVEARVGTRVVVSTRSAADGSYRLEVPAGTYTVATSPQSMLPRCPPRDVHVGRGATVDLDIDCDTGIR